MALARIRRPSDRLFRFLAVGVGAALILFALSFVFRALGAAPFVASTTAYAFAFAFAYSTQRRWTFGGVHRHAEALPRYLGAQLVCAAVAGFVAHAVVETSGEGALWMSAAATIAAGVTSYVLSSLWVFPLRSSEK